MTLSAPTGYTETVLRRLLTCGMLAMAACSPASARSPRPPRPHPLPDRVQGAHLRPVGDLRRGYGTETARKTMRRLQRLGINTLGILLKGRMASPHSTEIRMPSPAEIEAARQALLDAHAMGLATLLVPHLYMDDGGWRGDITLSGPGAPASWWTAYRRFMERTAQLAAESGTTVLSVGVELKGLSGRPAHDAPMREVIRAVRTRYAGALTYSANWDEAAQVLFWDAVDYAGVNGYYPLEPDPVRGAEAVARRLSTLAANARRPVLVAEVGYRSSPLSHLRPWEWPDQVEPLVDEASQAKAWAAVVGHWPQADGVRGLVVWVIPTDPDDPASEPRHGFNPLNKAAQTVLLRAFTHDLRAGH